MSIVARVERWQTMRFLLEVVFQGAHESFIPRQSMVGGIVRQVATARFLSGESVFMKAPIKERFRAFVSEAKESIIGAFESVREAAKQPDKRKHFIVGALIAFVLGILIAPWVGFIAGCLAAILKEWWDSKGHGTVEVMDALFTILGSAFGTLFAVFVIWLFHLIIPWCHGKDD